jgi:hypothetical protein
VTARASAHIDVFTSPVCRRISVLHKASSAVMGTDVATVDHARTTAPASTGGRAVTLPVPD